MLFSQKHYCYKSTLGFDKFGACSFHAASISNNMFVKHVKVKKVKIDVACLDKGKSVCLNDCIKLKSKVPSRKQTPTKFIPTSYHCGIVDHTRPD